jgi:cellulose synthase/poly-beta-1,6-N-acetylglucosamine synthase-like glycosyltransferase
MGPLHRTDRKGYKAGALEAGLAQAKGEFIAIFDADFIPPPEFLGETLPYFVDPRVGMVQARWGHINHDYSLLTRIQSMGIDGHFGVEQPARSWGGLFMNFNGTAGIWRKKAIDDAGGWEHDTLTEDLDLSYRAQLKGWKLEFSPGMVCPAELPVHIHAFKAQQHRWAKGSIQVARKLLGRILRARIPLFVKLEAVLHLTHYLVHPMMLIVVLTSLPMLFTQWFYASLSYPIMFFSLITLATCGPSSLYFYSQRLLYRDWLKNIKYLPLLVCLGTGIAVSNTKAILEAFGKRTGAFIRTPKYDIWSRADNWRRKTYRSPESLLSILEFLMGCYALVALILFLTLRKYFISPFLVIYTLGFFSVFTLSMSHSIGGERRKFHQDDR